MKLLEATLGPAVERVAEAVGKTSVATGLALNGAEKVGWLDGFTMVDVASAFALVGSIMYIIKIGLDIFVTLEKRREAKREKEASK